MVREASLVESWTGRFPAGMAGGEAGPHASASYQDPRWLGRNWQQHLEQTPGQFGAASPLDSSDLRYHYMTTDVSSASQVSGAPVVTTHQSLGRIGENQPSTGPAIGPLPSGSVAASVAAEDPWAEAARMLISSATQSNANPQAMRPEVPPWPACAAPAASSAAPSAAQWPHLHPGGALPSGGFGGCPQASLYPGLCGASGAPFGAGSGPPPGVPTGGPSPGVALPSAAPLGHAPGLPPPGLPGHPGGWGPFPGLAPDFGVNHGARAWPGQGWPPGNGNKSDYSDPPAWPGWTYRKQWEIAVRRWDKYTDVPVYRRAEKVLRSFGWEMQVDFEHLPETELVGPGYLQAILQVMHLKAGIREDDEKRQAFREVVHGSMRKKEESLAQFATRRLRDFSKAAVYGIVLPPEFRVSLLKEGAALSDQTLQNLGPLGGSSGPSGRPCRPALRLCRGGIKGRCLHGRR